MSATIRRPDGEQARLREREEVVQKGHLLSHIFWVELERGAVHGMELLAAVKDCGLRVGARDTLVLQVLKPECCSHRHRSAGFTRLFTLL